VAIAGVMGFASVLGGVFYFYPRPLDNFSAESHITVTIERLKDAYKVGEPVDFIVTLEGYGCDAGFPSVMIYKESSKEPVWSRSAEIRLFPAGYSCPHEEIHHVRHIGDVVRYNNDEQERVRTLGGMPIIINEEGRYVVDIESMTKEFTVIS
jgi:hypothetical protein